MEYKMTTDLQVGDRVRSVMGVVERIESVLPYVNKQGVAQFQWRMVTLSVWKPVVGSDYGTLTTRIKRAHIDYEWHIPASVTTGKVSA